MKVKFLPQNVEVEISSDKTLLQVAHENGVAIRSVCRGKLSCTECRVKIVQGEANCLPPSRSEMNLLGTAWILDGQRFSCQVRCFGDVSVDLTEQTQKTDSQKKNIRGFKSNRNPAESKAVIDTMLLGSESEKEKK